MSERHDPDVTIAAWLDEGPTSLPPVTRQVIDSSIRVTPRRRRSIIRSQWEGHIMFTAAVRLVATAVVAVVIAGSGSAFFLMGSNPLGSDDGEAVPSASERPLAIVSGTSSCTDATGGTTEAFHGLYVTHGATMECTTDVDDQRVGGAWTVTWNTAHAAGSGRALDMWWGTSHREDAEGAWDCSWFLPDDPSDQTFFVHNVCHGGGAYEGLTYVFEHIMGGTHDGGLIGYIYEGPPLGQWVPASE